MTPALETLAPETGLATSFGVIPPQAGSTPLWKVLVDIGGAATGAHPFAHVGAYDANRRGALERGAGEAVERSALRRAGFAAERRSLNELRADAAQLWWPAWVDEGSWADHPHAWYQGEECDGSGSVLVPAPAIDYAPELHGGRASAGELSVFDPSPSGAASGLDRESATRSALLEVIERDAVLCAWAAQTGVGRVADIRAVDDPVTARLLMDAARSGLHPVFGKIATAVPGVNVVCCAIVDRSGRFPLTAFGSKASSSFRAAERGALQEALQIHDLLQSLSAQRARPSAFDDPVASLLVDDVARAWWWTTEVGAESMERWIARWDNPSPSCGSEAGAEPSSGTLAEWIVRDGGNPIVVDLTDRLCGAVRALGWQVVKAVCPGYQQLRLDETISASWDRRRVVSWARQRGRTPAALPILPHPLI